MTKAVPRRSLAARARGPDRAMGLVLVVATVMLAWAWVLPLMTIRKFWLFADEISLLQSVHRLYAEGEYFLFAVVVLFTVLFPAAKLVCAALVWWGGAIAGDGGPPKALGLIDTLGKWSMLDVFVAALVVVAVKVSLVSDVEIHEGVYVFSAAVVLSMLAVRRISWLARRGEPEGGAPVRTR